MNVPKCGNPECGECYEAGGRCDVAQSSDVGADDAQDLVDCECCDETFSPRKSGYDAFCSQYCAEEDADERDGQAVFG